MDRAHRTPWRELSPDYERARAREDSFDRLVEWPAQRHALGDVRGLSVLDVGCGNGGKLVELAAAGAARAVGIDLAGSFPTADSPAVELIHGDLDDLHRTPGVTGYRFDRVLFLQSFGYAHDPVATLRTARDLLADDGFILLTRTNPIRYAVQRAEERGTSLGEEYYSTDEFSYAHRWNPDVRLVKRPYTVSDLLNTFSDAGLWVERTWEPQLSAQDRATYPHKAAFLDQHLGIFVFRLRPR